MIRLRTPVALCGLRRDERGAYMVELAMVLPVFLMLTMGIFDIGIQMYAKAALAGAVEAAARESTLESNNTSQAAVDQKVRDRVAAAARFATLAFKRTNYTSFADVNQPENFTDSNNNGRRDPGECFEDANSNGVWNSDRGGDGQGGADDVVIYKVRMSFDRLFPLWKMLGQPQRTYIEVTTTLRNQPFTTQTDSTVVVCS